jgi:hypothetical protein
MLLYPVMSGPQPWVLLGFAILVAIAGVAQAYLGIRVEFDAALFDRLARAPEAPDFAATDAALTRLGLLPAAKRGRPVEARVSGATRLLRFQILALGAQVLILIASAYAAARPQ